MKTLAVLGSTGTIGRQTLEIVSSHPQDFQIAALAAGKNIALLREQMMRHRPRAVAVIDEEQAEKLRAFWDGPPVTILAGSSGYRQLATMPEVNLVVSAMVGAAGLLPTWEAIQAGKDVALANKEALVIAGELIMPEVRRRGVRLLPVDSEHSAIFQCLAGVNRPDVHRIILTASGGPFLSVPKEELSQVTPAMALHHPNWSMGKKITIDSATMMNKALEVIEARWLFSLPPERISVVIHPQSIIHSLVELVDGSVLAQMSLPDMRIPISYALYYPERMVTAGRHLKLCDLAPLTFLPPDGDKFPCLNLAQVALTRGGVSPTVINGANEVAVGAFLAGKIRFPDIYRIIATVLDQFPVSPGPLTWEMLLAADVAARRAAEACVNGDVGEA